jgi:aldose 1-epimerase
METILSGRDEVSIVELEPVLVRNEVDYGSNKKIRVFALTLNNVTVQLCSLGASIARIVLPSLSNQSIENEDIVLGFDSVKEMYESQNPVYFGVCTGRVTNRIRQGRLQTHPNGTMHQLAINNDPNHLHGGVQGFSRQIWEAEIIDPIDNQHGIRFSLVSEDGDQGYPGKVKVSVAYTLRPTPSACSVKLCVEFVAELLSESPSPIILHNTHISTWPDTIIPMAY